MTENVGVRWQREMEAHLDATRQTCSIVAGLLQKMTVAEGAAVAAQLAQANAIAALALAVANHLGDIDTTLSDLVHVIDERGE